MAVFYNHATLTYQGGTVNSNLVAGELTDAAVLTKTAVSADYRPDGTVAYALSVVNDSAAPLPLTLTDDLGGYTYNGATVYPLVYKENSLQLFVNGAPQDVSALTVTPGPPLTVDGLVIPAGGSAVLVYEAEITPFAPLGTDAEIVNTVSTAAKTVQLTASDTLPMAGDPVLSITKSMNPQSLMGGEAVTYTFLLQNAGAQPADAAADLSVTDVFDPLLTDLAVALDGTPLAQGTDYTYDPVSGEFATAAGRITVPAATYSQDGTGAWSTLPGTATLTVTGTLLPPNA